MSQQLDSILARSRSPGRFVERRSFTLSRDKAVEKLREFSLRHPEQYILELVQAAVFAGARWIAIDVSKDRLFFAWVGGRPYTGSQLEQVFDYLFTDRAAAETRHVVQLAVALNAILQRKPKVLRIESGDGSAAGTVRMDLDADGKGHLGQPEQAFQGTYLVVEHATNWFSRFKGDDWTREQSLVEERCLYSPVPILLNYRAPFGYRANKEITLYGVSGQVGFDEDGRRGVLAIAGPGQPADGIRLVVGGVWVSTRPVPLLGMLRGGDGQPQPLIGVICDDRLRKTADQSDIVEDGRFVDLLHAVQPHATELIRTQPGNRSHKPPDLPRRVAEVAPQAGPAPAAAPAGPTPEPLPERIEQVAPRPVLDLEALQGLRAGTPVFWIDPDTAGTLGASGGPERFPFRLLVLRPGQALTLGREAPELSLAPLTSGADAEFVSRVFERQSDRRVLRVPVHPADGLGGRGSLELRLHRQGEPPAWGAQDHESLPVIVRIARRSSWCGGLGLGLPGVSALVELDAGSWDPDAGGVALTTLVRLHAWRLLEDVDEARRADQLHPVDRRLLIALLAMHARPQLYLREGRPALALTLPRAWGDAGARFRRVPLVDAVEGPLCLDDLVALQGTAHMEPPATRTLLDPDDGPGLEPLKLRLGIGHLLSPTRAGCPLLAVAEVGAGRGGRWVRWDPRQPTPGPEPRAVVWLGDDLRPTLDEPGWRAVSWPAPAVGFALRADPTPTRELIDLDEGLALLAEHLGTVVREDLWPGMLPEGCSEDRARQLGRLALIALAVATGDDEARVLPSSSGAGWLPVGALAAGSDSPVRISVRKGPRVVERDTVLLSMDEVGVLHGAGIPTPLRFDDPPELWHSLSEPATPDGSDNWLLREALQIPGLEGWLGLRDPYDPTSAVLLQQSGELHALTEVDRHVPCHGMAWSLGSTDTLSRVQHELLELARLRLYQRLADHLEGGAALPGGGPTGGAARVDAWRAVATCYAIDFAVHHWRSAGGDTTGGTAARFLSGIRLEDPDGGSLGSLQAWLSLPPDQRPLPAGHAATWIGIEQLDGPGRVRGDYAAAVKALERRLTRVLALAAQETDLRVHLRLWEGGARRAPVRIWDEASGAGSIGLDLNEHHPVVYTALAEPGDAREILLVEAGRVATRVVREAGGSVDLLHLHQLLGAQRR